MSNSYFQFKEFIINQEACSMKVCTDACILGAWFSEKIPLNALTLDAGSGTGLLMLMLAQKNKGLFHGIEIDFNSYKQSIENINANKWKDRMKVFHGDFCTYSLPEKYDFIISNPPFFDKSLPSPHPKKNIAKHSYTLTLEQLLKGIELNLKPTGSFGILLPYNRTSFFEKLAIDHNYYLIEKLLIKQSSEDKYFRSILHFSINKRFASDYELAIQESEGGYTREFKDLMKEYYLNL
jgi:tRNA1Val (adenine37-N6)-methyltransferase